MTFTKTDHAIVYTTLDPGTKRSAIIFNGKYILAPAVILLNTVTEYGNYLLNDLKEQHLIHITDNEWDQRMNKLKQTVFLVIHNNGLDRKSLLKSRAKLLYIYQSSRILTSINEILLGFRGSNSQSDVNEDIVQCLLTTFLLLKFDTDKNTHSFSEILNNLVPNKSYKFGKLNQLDKIASVTTPFGSEPFFNTLNVGHIANIFGPNDCLIVGSMALAPGCEGGAVYSIKHELIGIIINTTFYWNGENAHMTLIANFGELLYEPSILSGLMGDMKFPIAKSPSLAPNRDDFVVLIKIGGHWGSGCFVQLHSQRFIITCAHVIGSHQNTINCYWKFGKFSSEIIYSNPNYHEPYDIALLSVPDNIPDNHFTKCDETEPKIGQQIFSVGFPHFSHLGTQYFAPSIYPGRVTKVSEGLFFTDANVQAGQSGGPILTYNNKLLGVLVSNSRDANNIIYPYINMSIPIVDIYWVLEKYADTSDSKILDGLQGNHYVKKLWALDSPQILNKL